MGNQMRKSRLHEEVKAKPSLFKDGDILEHLGKDFIVYCIEHFVEELNKQIKNKDEKVVDILVNDITIWTNNFGRAKELSLSNIPSEYSVEDIDSGVIEFDVNLDGAVLTLKNGEEFKISTISIDNCTATTIGDVNPHAIKDCLREIRVGSI